MRDETNGHTSNQTDRNEVSASEELHVLSAESLDLVAGGGNGTIIIGK
jgi:hypothetical protein